MRIVNRTLNMNVGERNKIILLFPHVNSRSNARITSINTWKIMCCSYVVKNYGSLEDVQKVVWHLPSILKDELIIPRDQNI